MDKLCKYSGWLFVVVVLFVSSGFVEGSVVSKDSLDGCVLVTGFEPFSIYDVNPTELICGELNGTVIENYSVVSVVLPVNFSESMMVMIDAIAEYDPDVIMSLGMNGEAYVVQVEVLGRNARKRPRSDPFWFLPLKLVSDGPWFQVSSLPTCAIVRAIRSEGIGVRHSLDAGTYVCNSVLYQTLEYLDRNSFDVPMGFLHIPALPSQEPQGMDLSVSVAAVQVAIGTVIDGLS